MQEELENPTTALQDAAARLQAGHVDDAAKIIDGVLACVPANAEALQLKGLVARQAGDFTAAVAFYTRSLALNRDQANVWNNLGNAYSALGRRSDAILAYREALRLAPNYVDALLNLGLAEIAAADFAAAAQALSNAVKAAPQHAGAWSAYGRALGGLGQLDAAIGAFHRSLALRPGDAVASHSLSIALRRAGRSEEALPWSAAAASAAPERPEIFYNLGHCLFETNRIDEAFAAYRKAIELKPDYRAAHGTLNRLYWEHDRLTEHLQSYESAVQKAPHAAGLWADWMGRLNLLGELDKAISIGRRALSLGVDDAEIHHRLGEAFCARMELSEGLAALAAAVARKPADADFRRDYARALIKAGRPREALQELDAVLRAAPYDQRALAYAGLALRLLGDPKAHTLNNYDRFVSASILPAPPGYPSIEVFNDRLGAVLAKLHVASRHPLEQTLRGGTQTMGTLLDKDQEEIRAIRELLNDAVARYIAELPDDPGHPFLGRRTGGFRFQGSWSVRLKGEGFHTSHVHPKGWISSAYYVALPDVLAKADSDEGAIKFGDSGMGLGDFDRPAKIIRPRVGMLVLFPSYIYHGTIPFSGAGTRMTIAFDITPA